MPKLQLSYQTGDLCIEVPFDMSTPHETPPVENHASGAPPARSARPGAKRMTLSCENCQRRKTRCDARQPSCANCEALGLRCSTRTPKRKRGRHAKVTEHRRPQARQEPSTRVISPPNVHDTEEYLSVNVDDTSELLTSHSHNIDDTRDNEESNILSPSSSTQRYQSYNSLLATPQPVWNVWDDITPGAVIEHSPVFVPDLGVKPLFDALSQGLAAAGITEGQLGYVASCVELFFRKIYPTYPVVYRPILDEAIKQLELGLFDLDHRTFALLTATCSYTLAVLPVTTSSNSWPAATVFYRLSRATLAQYTEDDIENPDHSSLVIRMFQSGWAHVAGKRKTSWNMLGECIRLAQAMRLHDESVYARMSHLEGQMCRRAFWTLYTGDKSSAVLGGHPVCLGEAIFRGVVPVGYPEPLGDQDVVFVETNAGETRQMNMLTGFNANQDLWRTAERLLDFDLSHLNSSIHSQDEPNRSQRLLDSYLSEFHACLDALPECLSSYTSFSPTAENFRFQGETTSHFSSEAMAIQRTNLQVSHLCLKMLITRRIHESQSATGSSWNGQEELRKTTSLQIANTLCIARDLLYIIHTSSIELIRLNGEACVEKIRLIGASLLELIAKNPDIPTHSILRRYQELFPHILARLDSKASEVAEN